MITYQQLLSANIGRPSISDLIVTLFGTLIDLHTHTKFNTVIYFQVQHSLGLSMDLLYATAESIKLS